MGKEKAQVFVTVIQETRNSTNLNVLSHKSSTGTTQHSGIFCYGFPRFYRLLFLLCLSYLVRKISPSSFSPGLLISVPCAPHAAAEHRLSRSSCRPSPVRVAAGHPTLCLLNPAWPHQPFAERPLLQDAGHREAGLATQTYPGTVYKQTWR